MSAITAIAQIGALIGATKGLVAALGRNSNNNGGGGDFKAQLASQIKCDAKSLVQARDTNGSGGLCRAEFGINEALFARLDANGDGQVTAAEIAASEMSITKILAAGK